ncbi:MAG TPA: ribosome small subunit-dependent GTPase A [Rhodothermales bacterium]|nr:ribosome small subunit-dependent GTPase A [Rhodothermales bacterium]
MAGGPDAIQPPSAGVREGLVVRSTGSWVDVQTEEGLVPSKIRGKFRLAEDEATNPVAVGDNVTLRLNEDGTGLITGIHERRNRLSRRAAGRRVGIEHVIAANIDRAWLVQSIRQPKINTGLIDRFLVMAESNDIPPALVFNKTDLMKKADRGVVMELHDLYADLGYPLLMTSAVTLEGVDTLREWLAGNVNTFSGPSGVGKSSLLNAVEPGLKLATAEVSDKTNKGRHTTTFAALYPLSTGGYVVDTPGIREFGIVDLEPEELSYYFIEFRPYLPECRFPNCTHDHEPGCAVQAAVETGEISDIRYYSYLNILESLRLGERDVGR